MHDKAGRYQTRESVVQPLSPQQEIEQIHILMDLGRKALEVDRDMGNKILKEVDRSLGSLLSRAFGETHGYTVRSMAVKLYLHNQEK